MKFIEMESLRGRRGAALYGVACIALAVVAGWFNWQTGHRGISPLDQSIIFDGAWRIAQGEVPYKDFLMPFGPVTFWIQAAFFKVFGATWTATVIAASLVNATATLVAMRVTRFLTGGSRVLAVCAGVGTAVSFQAVFGTLFLEQTAMLMDLLALASALESMRAGARRAGLWRAASGSLVAVALLSKQNFGVMFLPIVWGVMTIEALPEWKAGVRRVAESLAGMACVLAGFGVWLWAYSDAGEFAHRVLGVAAKVGAVRMQPWALMATVGMDTAPNQYQPDMVGLAGGVAALALAVANLRSGSANRELWRELAPAGVVAAMAPLYRSFLQATTWNDWENQFGLTWVALAVGVRLLSRAIGLVTVEEKCGQGVRLKLPSGRAVRMVMVTASAVWGLAALQYAGSTAWNRTVQGFEKRTSFTETVRVRGMERVKWGEPTLANRAAILRKADFEGLAAELGRRGERFFVMGDSAMLYGLLGVQSPQPLLYFQNGHAFLEDEIPRLDGMVLAALKRNDVRIIVREKKTWLVEVMDSYRRFEKTWAWSESEFVKTAEYGNYEVWIRRGGAVSRNKGAVIE